MDIVFREDKRKMYNKRFYENNKDRLLDTLWCATCHGTFNYYNKSNHFRTLKHVAAELRVKGSVDT